jgi:hypothetical protein
MVNIQGLPVALALLCVALVGCQSLERPFDDGKEWEEPERIENTSKGWARLQPIGRRGGVVAPVHRVPPE